LPKVAATPLPNNQSQIYLVDIPKAAQTEFRVGYNTGLKYDATGEFYKAGLMNYILGGSFNGRLNINLREDKGWTYGPVHLSMVMNTVAIFNSVQASKLKLWTVLYLKW
jgi:zinc protease